MGADGIHKVLAAYSVSHGKSSAWLPVIELLRNYFEFADEDDSRRSEKAEAKVRALDPALAETLPYILSLLGFAGAGAPLASSLFESAKGTGVFKGLASDHELFLSIRFCF